MSWIRRRLAEFGSAWLLSVALAAQWGGETKLDPREVTSPSGAVTLFIDPSRPNGAGAATYRCRRGASELWAGERPWTLWEAVVGDDGVVAGYAYGNGHDGGGKDDSFTLVILAPDGTARLEERLPRAGFSSDLGRPEPRSNGCFLDADNGRFVVRVATEVFGPAESWWSYALADGTAGAHVDPRAAIGEDRRLGPILAVRAVPGTGLVLAQWYHSDWEKKKKGVVFALLERDGKSVWRLDWLDDFGKEELRWPLEGSILETASGRFTLRSKKSQERVTFAVERVTGAREGWAVREVERTPQASATATSVSLSPPKSIPPVTLELAHLGTIDLSATASRSPIHDVMTFALDGHGRIGFVRRTDERFDFVRVDADGQNLQELALSEPPEGAWWTYTLAWSAGDSWILCASDSGPGDAQVWRIEAAAGRVVPLAHFAAPDVENLAATKEGGFVVLGATSDDSGYSTNDLVAFDASGQRRLALGGDQGDSKDEGSLFAPEALAVLASGELVVLDNIRDLLQFYSESGEFLYALELEQAWGREPNYPSEVMADPDGGVLVHDFNGTPPIVRMDRDGKVLAEFQPRHADGATFRIRSGVQVGPGGALWTSDGQALLRLDPSGLVSSVLGPSASADELGKIARLALGPGDRIHAVDPRTGAVHVFTPEGRRLHVCRPAPKDFDEELSLPSLSVNDSAEVLLDGLAFAADGTRIGFGSWPEAGYKPDFHARRGAEGAWIVGYEELLLVARDGKIARKIERTPGGNWLRDLGTASVAPDGSIALTTDAGFGGGTPGIHLYDAKGAPVRSLPAPEGIPGWAPFAYDGARLVFGLQRQGKPGTVVLLDIEGRELGRFTPPGDVRVWIPYFAAGGKELWLFDMGYRIERYALP
ncbi:MAG: hypothetical protein ABL998_05500 [Planctomycetota bacterium]